MFKIKSIRLSRFSIILFVVYPMYIYVVCYTVFEFTWIKTIWKKNAEEWNDAQMEYIYVYLQLLCYFHFHFERGRMKKNYTKEDDRELYIISHITLHRFFMSFQIIIKMLQVMRWVRGWSGGFIKHK